MADWKIPALASKSVPAGADLLALLDVSDTSTAPADASGSNKKVTAAALLGAARARYNGKFTSFHVDDYGADPTGTSDSTSAFVNAAAAATSAISGGSTQAAVAFGMGSYKVSGGNVNVSADIGFTGPGSGACTLLAQGAGAVIARTKTEVPGTGAIPAPVQGFKIDGTSASGTAYGISDTDAGGAWYQDLFILNFTGAAMAGLAQFCGTYWVEQTVGIGLRLQNCTIGHLQDGNGAPTPSFDYSDWFGIHFNIYPGQSGRTLRGSTPCIGGIYQAHANAHLQASGAAQSVWTIGTSSGDSSSISSCMADLICEQDGSGSTAYDFTIGSSAGLFATGSMQFPSFTANPAGGSGLLTGNINSPTFNRPIFKVVATGSGPGTSFGAYEHNTFGYAMQLPSATSSVGAAFPHVSSGVGAPSFSAPQGSLYIRQDTPGTSSQRLYYNTSSGTGTTWTALAV